MKQYNPTLGEFENSEWNRERRPYIKRKKENETYNYKKPNRSRFKLYFKHPKYTRTFYSYDNNLSKKGSIIKDEQIGFTQLMSLAKNMKVKFGKDAECKIFMSTDPECCTNTPNNHNELCFIIRKDWRVIANDTLKFTTLKFEDHNITNIVHQVVYLKKYERKYLK